MKLLVRAYVASQPLFDLFNDAKESSIPKEVRSSASRKDIELVFQAILISDERLCLSELVSHYVETSEYDGVASLIDESLGFSWSTRLDGAFVCKYRSGLEYLDHPLNVFHVDVKEALSNFVFLANMCKSFSDQRAMILPRNIFSLREFSDFFDELPDLVPRALFKDRLERTIAQIRKRARPKPNTRTRRRFFVDDRKRYFRFGEEKHGPCEMGGEHDDVCLLNSRFRMGMAYPQMRHFNVEEEKRRSSISFTGATCHGREDRTFKSATHLNVFPNGHIEEG